jgi:hypothetical protein
MAKVTINGHVSFLSPAQQAGNYTKKTMVVTSERENGYRDQYAVTVFGENSLNKIEGVMHGDLVEVTAFVRSREYQGRWYTELNLWDCKKVGGTEPQTAPQVIAPQDDDLPFEF